MAKIERAAGLSFKPTTERIGGVAAKRIWYVEDDKKHLHVYFNKDGMVPLLPFLSPPLTLHSTTTLQHRGFSCGVDGVSYPR